MKRGTRSDGHEALRCSSNRKIIFNSFIFLQAELELGKRTPSPKTLDAKTLLKENRTNGHVNGGYANGHANGVANGHSILNGNINV